MQNNTNTTIMSVVLNT